MGILLACMSMYHVHSIEVKGEHCVSWAGIRDSCELLCGWWDLNLSPLEEQSAF